MRLHFKICLSGNNFKLTKFAKGATSLKKLKKVWCNWETVVLATKPSKGLGKRCFLTLELECFALWWGGSGSEDVTGSDSPLWFL